MAGIIESETQGGTANPLYRFGGDFQKGTAPTLLEAAEAQRIKRFVENLVFRALTRIRTGTPDRNGFKLNLTDPNQAIWEMDIRTALECDPDPTLGADLNLLAHGIRATRPGGSGTGPFFYQYGTDGLTVVPENWPAATTGAYGGKIRLMYNGNSAGLVANSAMSGDVIFTMPEAGDTGDAILMSSISNTLGFSSITAGDNITITRSGEGTGRDFEIAATGSAGGTVTDITVNSDDATGGTITASGTITVSGGKFGTNHGH